MVCVCLDADRGNGCLGFSTQFAFASLYVLMRFLPQCVPRGRERRLLCSYDMLGVLVDLTDHTLSMLVHLVDVRDDRAGSKP